MFWRPQGVLRAFLRVNSSLHHFNALQAGPLNQARTGIFGVRIRVPNHLADERMRWLREQELRLPTELMRLGWDLSPVYPAGRCGRTCTYTISVMGRMLHS